MSWERRPCAFAGSSGSRPNRWPDSISLWTKPPEPPRLYLSWAAYQNIVASRFNEAKSWLARAEALKSDSLDLRIARLRLAFIEGDRGAFDRIFDGESQVPSQAMLLRQQFEAQQG